MNIQKTQTADKLTVAVEGRLDTTSSPKLEGELRSAYDSISDLTIDLSNLTYISSAGLRVLLSAQKVMNKKGHMTICNVRPEIMDVFKITGFLSILNIE